MTTDPLRGGLVASLSQPGGNVTGLSSQQSELAGKRLELLREVLPNLRRLAVMANAGYLESVLELGEVQAIARNLGIESIKLEVRRAEDIGPAFEGLKGQADALYVVADGLLGSNRLRIVTFALAAHLPTIFNQRAYVAAGGFLSYGPNLPAQFRRAAEIVDKVLHGAKPGEIPVEQPTKFDFIINLTTADAAVSAMAPLGV